MFRERYQFAYKKSKSYVDALGEKFNKIQEILDANNFYGDDVYWFWSSLSNEQ